MARFGVGNVAMQLESHKPPKQQDFDGGFCSSTPIHFDESQKFSMAAMAARGVAKFHLSPSNRSLFYWQQFDSGKAEAATRPRDDDETATRGNLLLSWQAVAIAR